MNIVIWGTGYFERRLFEEGLSTYAKENLIGYLETLKSKKEYRLLPVYDFLSLPSINIDYIIVAFNGADEAYEIAKSNGILFDRLVLPDAGQKYRWFNSDSRIKDLFTEKQWNQYLANYGVIKGSFFYNDLYLYERYNNDPSFIADEKYYWPIINEKYSTNGTMDAYFWQDLWGAKKVIKSGVSEHWDVGSSVKGFIAHILAAQIKVNVIDIRPFTAELEGLSTVVSDATYLTEIYDNSINSFSALCSLEHFGLGRYGDPINPDAWRICIDNIQKKVMSGGNIYISVPIGRQRLEFNAHRIFDPITIINSFNSCLLEEFSTIKCDCSGIEKNARTNGYDNIDGHLIGLFHFIRK